MTYLMGKTKINQLRALGHVIEYVRGRADYVRGEDNHIAACKAHILLDDARKLMETLPEERPDEIDTL